MQMVPKEEGRERETENGYEQPRHITGGQKGVGGQGEGEKYVSFHGNTEPSQYQPLMLRGENRVEGKGEEMYTKLNMN